MPGLDTAGLGSAISNHVGGSVLLTNSGSRDRRSREVRAGSDTRCAIVGRAKARLDELVASVVTAIFDSVPMYASVTTDVDLADIQSGVRRSAELCLLVLDENRRLNDDERAALHFTGGQRARQGIPKAAVLRSVTYATRHGYKFLVACAADPDHDVSSLAAALQGIRGLLDDFEDDAIHALADGYDEAYASLLNTAGRREAILVDRLLERRWHEDDELARHAVAVGLQTKRNARLLVITGLEPPTAERLEATVERVRSLAPVALGPLRATTRLHLPVVIQPRDESVWGRVRDELDVAAKRQRTVIIVGDRAVSLAEVADLYRPIEASLRFLSAATGKHGVISALLVRFHRVMSVGTPDDQRELRDFVLAPLLASRDRDELLSTLDALYDEGGSWASLARVLGLHKNTLSNRMRRVLTLTGLDVQRPPERLVLELMLRQRHVAEPEPLTQ